MKKRILSLILALSMVLSVLPLGAFAEGSNQGLTIGSDGYPVGTSGTGWSYDNNTKTLTLTEGTFDFSSTVPVQCAIDSIQTIIGGTFNGKVRNIGTISGGTFNETVTNASTGTISDGTFNGDVTNYGTIKDNGTFEGTVTNKINGLIYGGTFQNKCSVTNDGTITGNGIFAGIVTNNRFISGGTFQSTSNVTNANDGTISDGTFAGSVTNKGTITGNGTFNATVTNNDRGKITNGTFNGTVTNWSTISGGTFQNTCSVTNNGTIKDNGIFEGEVKNYTSGTILDGTFRGEVDNSGAIEKGTFEGSVQNNNRISGGTFQNGCSVTNLSTISGGTFQNTCSVTNHGYIKDGTFAGKVTNDDGTIYGGTFAGSVENKWKIYGGVFNGNTALTGARHVTVTNGSLSQVNGVDPRNADGTTGTAWDLYSYKDTTMTITADTEIFSLNGQPIDESNYPNKNDKKTVTFTMPDANVVLGTGELVMKDGFPEASNGGKNPCKGNGWEYRNGTLYLYDGMYDFSTIGDGSAVECKIEISSMATITGGTFTGTVTNSGTINDGTFNGAVKNNRGINSGTFNETVTNEGTITGGVFKGVVENDGQGKIVGGTFAGGVNNENDRIYGGVFNGNATLTNVTGLHSITVASGAKITEVNGVPAEWEPYVVVTQWTKSQEVTITADTEIFSLNGQPIDAGNCNSSYGSGNNIVTFTMPGEPVVLNRTAELEVVGGEIESGETAKGSGRVLIGGKVEVTTKDKTQDFVGWTIAPEGIELRDDDGREVDLTSEWTFSFMMPDVSGGKLTLTANYQPFRTSLLMNADGTVNLEHVYSETYDGNETRKGDGWNVFNRGTLILEKWTYDFRYTAPTEKTGTLEAVTCGVLNEGGTIENGVFRSLVLNEVGGTITGGTFAAGLIEVPGMTGGSVTGGVFNGKTGLTNAHHVTVTDGSLLKVNGEDPLNADETTGTVTPGTAWDLYAYAGTTVTITADTEIFSLNGQPIAESSYGVDKKTVTFTMPDDDVVLNRAITSTDLVMVNGYPKDSNGGKNPCKGDGWEYIPNDPTNGDMLLLTGSNQTGGLFDFSTIGDGSAVECNVFVGKPTAITGGEFNGKVFNNSGILGGTFHGEVDNRAPGTIKGGTFNGAVENNGTIEKGTFEGTVENNTNGTISGGTFAGSVSNNGGTVTGGIFNGNTGLDGVTDLHSITVASGAKITEVNGVPAEWAPYVVTSNATTKEVTITADTEIFSLNGQPIAESSYGVDKKTVTFTMPDDDVVLNGELITKPEPEPEPEPKPEPEPEPKPEPEPTTYTVTVIGGTIDGKTSVSAKENDTLTVVLDQNDIPDGMTFDMWSISSSKLSGDINVDYRAEAMTFQMPAEDVTIRAQYRSAEIIEDAAPSPLATAATIAVGGAAAGIVVWQGVNLGVDLYLANALPQGVPVPTDRRALALLLWETAGKPEVALPTLYGDIPAEEIELQKATRWAIQNGLMDAADKKDASFFDPDHYVTKMDVFGAWLRLKKLLGTIGTSPTQ